MKFDVFFSICQTEVDGYMPDERTMWNNFFDQVRLADELGYGVAWVAETHLSCQTQKQTKQPVIPHFTGEIGLNTDILQLAHKIFAQTKHIEVGSAIRNILCNGGPMAHAEEIRTFLSLHGLNENEKRRLHIGFASGRFEFSNRPYGILPRNALEEKAWPVVKGKILRQATEIFLRFLRGETFSSAEVAPIELRAKDFREAREWQEVQELQKGEVIRLEPYWKFERTGVIPRESRLDLLNLVLGSHDSELQTFANTLMPVAVFNLSITPPEVIEETHRRMTKDYHRNGGSWQRDYMPRTALVFVDDGDGSEAQARAQSAWKTYWQAMEGTLDQRKVAQAVDNTLFGNPKMLVEKIKQKYHPNDRLMMWFDFNNHNNEQVKDGMRLFMKEVAPFLRGA